MGRGRRLRICDHPGWNTYLFGAACPERGVAAGIILPYANTEAMNLHLAEIASAVARARTLSCVGKMIPLILDGAGWHGGKGLVVPLNIPPLILPPYSPEINPVENVW